MMTVEDVRGDLLALSRDGDRLRGGEWSAVENWHSEVVAYVRAAMGDGPADDVANRLRCSRGSSQAEKESNAIGFVTDWIGTQAIGLTADKIVPGFDGTVPEPEPVEPISWQEYVAEKGAVSVSVEVVEEQETDDGDTGPTD